MECPRQGTFLREYGVQESRKTSFKILEQIRFQKFRYNGEGRSGKKKHKEDFMTLLVKNPPPASFLHVYMICVDADNHDKVNVHPNGLIGLGCHHGLYDMVHPVPAGTEDTFTIIIPYIRIERLKLKKMDTQIIIKELETRMTYLPSPYREYFAGQCAGVASSKDVDSTKVRLAVIVSGKGCSGGLEKPWDVSNVIKDGSQKTSLGILKLSRSEVPASTGAWVDVFTTDNSPPVKAGEYFLHVTYEPTGGSGKLAYWMSEETIPGEDCIIYKKIISYKIPPFEPNPCLKSPVKATLHLVYPESNMSCFCYFSYVPDRGQVAAYSGSTKLEPRNDSGVSMHMHDSPDRWRSTKRSRCDWSLDPQIRGSLKVKPEIKGDIICPVRCNSVIAAHPDCCPLSTDAQMSNTKVSPVHTSKSTKMVKHLSVRGIDESKTANNIWMAPTSVHHDSHTASNIWVTPTSIHHDSQTVSNNWMPPTFVHHDSQTANNNSVRPTSVHYESQRATTPPNNNVKTKREFTKDAIYMGNRQARSSGFGRPSSDNTKVLNEQRDCFVREKGASSSGQSTPSYGVQQPIRDVTVKTGRDIKPGCSNSHQLFTKHSSCMSQRAAQHDVSAKSLPFQNAARTNIPQHLKDNQCAKLVESTECQQEITVRPQDSDTNDWTSQNQPDEDIFDNTTNNHQSKAVSDLIKYLQSTEETGRFGADDGQISKNFLPNLDFSEASSMDQTAPTAISNDSGTHISTNLPTMELFAIEAENLPTLDVNSWLHDTDWLM